MKQERLEYLLTAIPPSAPQTDTVPVFERQAIENGVGVELPDDIFELAQHYGSGAFETADSDILLTILNPNSRTFFRDVNRHIGLLTDLHVSEGSAGFPYAIHPDSPGLLPIGNAEHRRFLSWFSQGGPSSWPLILRTPEGNFRRFEMPLIGFLASLISGEIDGFGGHWNKQWFRDHSADITFSSTRSRSLADFPPIHLAASAGWVNDLRERIQGGADPNSQDYEGCTPLFHGIERKSAETVGILLAAGADPNVTLQGVLSPLDLAVRRSRGVEIVSLLLNYHAEVNVRDVYGATPLIHAVNLEDIELVKTLLDAGASPNTTTNTGESPLNCARSEIIINLLKKAGARE